MKLVVNLQEFGKYFVSTDQTPKSVDFTGIKSVIVSKPFTPQSDPID